MSPQSAVRSPLSRVVALVAGLALVAGGAWLGSRGLPTAGNGRAGIDSAIIRPAGLIVPAQTVAIPGPQAVVPATAAVVVDRTTPAAPVASAVPAPPAPSDGGPTTTVPTTPALPAPAVTIPNPPATPPTTTPPPLPVDPGAFVGPLVRGLPSL